jgi:sugar phosphate isomerase/epimerase
MAQKLKAAWIGFRDPDAVDPFITYKQRAEWGFKAQDGDLSRLPGDRVENLKKFRDLGLTCLCTSSGPMRQIANDPNAIAEAVERAHFYDVKYVNIGWSTVISSFGEGYGHNGTYESVMEDIDAMNKLVAAFSAEGLTCLYHNHYQEFTVAYRGVLVMDMSMQQVDQRLKLKLVLGWVYVGGVDPLEYMDKAGNRIALIHVKDFTEVIKPRYLVNADKDTDFGFISVGAGRLNLREIFKKAVEMDLGWAIAEQDRVRHLNVNDSLHLAYLNMKETDYVE